jgi:hypothetical protein
LLTQGKTCPELVSGECVMMEIFYLLLPTSLTIQTKYSQRYVSRSLKNPILSPCPESSNVTLNLSLFSVTLSLSQGLNVYQWRDSETSPGLKVHQHDIFTSLEPAHKDCRLQKIKSAILFSGLFYFHTFMRDLVKVNFAFKKFNVKLNRD